MLQSVISVSKARANFFKIIEETNQSHNPIIITGKKNNAVILGLDDWNSIQETLYLMQSANNANRINSAIAELEAGTGVAKELIEE
jgi:prevent-host-death family protein